MVKVVKAGDRVNIFQALWESFSGLDKFTKLFVIATLLIVLVTPTVISMHFIFQQNASTLNENIATPLEIKASRSNSNPIKGIAGNAAPMVAQKVTPQTTQTYNVNTAEIISDLNALNAWRAQNNLPAVVPSKTLSDAAQWKADDMNNNNYFSHTDSLGRDPFTMMATFGYNYNTGKGENIYEGNTAASGYSGQHVVDMFKGSPTHNAVMLGSYTAVGIGRSYNASRDMYYWTQEFGQYMDTAVTYAVITSSLTPTPISPPTPTPIVSTWTFCANETTRCSFSGTMSVRYGANGSYYYKVFTNGTLCSNAVFGDPLVGTVKQCYYQPTSGSSVPTTPTLGTATCTGTTATLPFYWATQGANPVVAVYLCNVGGGCSQVGGSYTLPTGGQGATATGLASGTYTWYVKASNTGGSATSTTGSFACSGSVPTPTPSAFVSPVISAVSCSGGTAKLNFAWVTQGTGATVEVYYCDQTYGACNYLLAPAPYYPYPNQGPVLTTLTSGHTYAWFVEAQCSIGSGMSSVGSFTCY